MWSVADEAERPGVLAMTGPLIGRDHEVTNAQGLLADPSVRVVVVTGRSGVGKTRLALAAIAPLPPETRIFVALSAITDGQVMADAITAHVGEQGATARRPADALWQTFTGAPVTLLLDNLEQVPGAAEVVLDLLDGYPAATVVATSLREVGVPGERLIRLGPLSLSADADTEMPAEAAVAPAVRMFVQRLTTRDAGFRLAEDDLAAIEEICRVVGGLPLAIELAAARATAMPLRLMARQLADHGGLSLLEHGVAGAPVRHRSLNAALEWTAGLLEPAAADLLSRLSVFEGPAPLEAVTAVAADGERALDQLSTLLDLSLVETEASDPDEPLFLLLPPVRAFAAGRLTASGDRDEVVRRHDHYVRSRCSDGRPVRPNEVADVLATLDRVQLEGSVDAALELALQAARVATAPGARASVALRVEDLLERADDGSALEARALVWSVTHRPSDVSDREAYAAWTHQRVEQAIRTARRSGNVPALLDALELTIRTLPVTLDRELAVAGIQEGLALAERSDDAARLSRFRMWVGMASLAQGHEEAGIGLLRLAFAGGTAAGDRVATDYAAMHLRQAGVTDSGVPGMELPTLVELRDSAWRAHDGFAAAVVLSQLAGEAIAAGDVRAAAAHTSQMLPVGAERQVVEPLAAATILTVAVRVLVAAGDTATAATLQATLAPIEAVLQRAMSQAHYARYLDAVERIGAAHPEAVVAEPGSPGAQPPPSLKEAFQVAERAIARLVRRGAADVVEARPPQPVAEPAEWSEPVSPLTAREQDVLLMLAEGAGNREIAEALGISSKTVMHHTVAIYRKLGVRGRTEAAAWAIRTGLTRGR